MRAWIIMSPSSLQRFSILLPFPAGFPRALIGELRLGIVPFLAHEWLASTAGSYKWMLYGDDDTVWFLPGVMKVVEGLDPELPWLLTGTLCCTAMGGK